ncbi:hypothetical protein GBI69_10415, partial [Bifidobacterium longum]
LRSPWKHWAQRMLLGTKRERTGDKKGANRGQKGSEPGTKRERTGDVAKMCLLFDQGGDSNYLWTNLI